MKARRILHIVVLLALCASWSCKSSVESKFGTANEQVAGAPMFDEAPQEELAYAEEQEAPLDGAKIGIAKEKNEVADEGSEGKKGAKQKTKKPKQTWKKSVINANTSKLMIGEQEELPIQGMQVFAKVDGFRARVLIDFYFHNPDDTQYEGTFKLRLPEGASPYFLAFGESKVELDDKLGKPKPDTLYDDDKAARKSRYEPKEIMMQREASWIEPKEARMVPKKQASRAYKQTVRQRVDPALMEWGGAGVFNARIFPIQPKKVHRVVVGYDMNIERLDDDLVWSLPLPKDLPSSSVNLQIAKLPGTDITISTMGEPPLADGDNLYVHQRDLKVDSVDVRIKGVPQIAIQSDEAGLGSLFAARVQPNLPAVKTGSGSQDALLLMDKSLSANPEKFNIWVTMAKKLLDENRDSIKRFNVIFFDVETRAWRNDFVANTPEQVNALIDEANTMSLEGATDLGAALRRATALLGQSEELTGRADLFLLSDGAITWGEGDAFLLSEQLKRGGKVGSIFAYRTGLAGTDTRMLSHLTRETGGALFSVVGESEITQAVKAHRNRPFTLKSVKIPGAKDIVIAGRPQVIYPGQRLLLAGRGLLDAKKTEVIFELERTGKVIEVKSSIEHVVNSPLASRTYGQIAVDHLEELLGSTRPFAEAYARHFRVAGKSTSLLMLESEADYEQHGIVPRDDLGAIKERTVKVAMLNAFDEMALRLGDARAALFYIIEELGTMPGVEAKLPEKLMEALKDLPREAFEMKSSDLACTLPQKKQVSRDLLAALAKRDVSYDLVSKEAERRLKKGSKGDALRAVSSLVEQSPGDNILALDVGYSAMNWGLPGHAYYLFERVADARPYEPQAWRALANAAVAQKKHALATAYFEIGLAGSWDSRFGEFKRILAQDYLRFINTQGQSAPGALENYLSGRRSAVMDIFGVKSADMVITITWNTDNTDVDLHVMEPSGEECYYGHRQTKSGGELTQDVTQGYGPEMYVLKKAPKGKYRVRAKYFSSDRNRKSARTKVHATIIRNWGRKDESVEQRIVTLEDNKDMHDLITISHK